MAGSARTLELGVFIPVGNGGWITSTNSPQLPATYEYNKQVTLLAEKLGLDFALSMAKWRGYGGETNHWDVTLESITTMAGLAEATQRIKIWGTVHMMIFPPAIVAKMSATLDQISGGRFGLNLVSGSNPYDLSQMGLWKDLNHGQRYDLGEEWIKVVRRLWTEDRVDHKGTYFELNDCMSYPKPSRHPTIICAGQSDRGFRFTVENCDVAFFWGSDDPASIKRALRAKEIAREMNKPDFKTNALVTLIPGRTDEEAQARLDHYNAGVDKIALATQAVEYSTDVSVTINQAAQNFLKQNETFSAVLPGTMAGSPETLAKRLAYLVNEGDIDSVTLIVPDFIGDLETVGREVTPLLRKYGIETFAASKAASVEEEAAR
ncbi:LLM class flavin-dependent oxidoreductase [Cohnella sp. AR92]|uniref:LLM class flavin-dependent oxidoreductase n=1 Tax=Cohnella sp. AR92 TaxID=648716 RepID=UPI000F8C4AC2|nr:LLM class flavin-dependent oxidoreductase [Cohnella sp. AR92]RUS45562.1 LLM class flavin-dependent oxidoreductase [Cohnella sp. AR92]